MALAQYPPGREQRARSRQVEGEIAYGVDQEGGDHSVVPGKAKAPHKPRERGQDQSPANTPVFDQELEELVVDVGHPLVQIDEFGGLPGARTPAKDRPTKVRLPGDSPQGLPSGHGEKRIPRVEEVADRGPSNHQDGQGLGQVAVEVPQAQHKDCAPCQEAHGGARGQDARADQQGGNPLASEHGWSQAGGQERAKEGFLALEPGRLIGEPRLREPERVPPKPLGQPEDGLDGAETHDPDRQILPIAQPLACSDCARNADQVNHAVRLVIAQHPHDACVGVKPGEGRSYKFFQESGTCEEGDQEEESKLSQARVVSNRHPIYGKKDEEESRHLEHAASLARSVFQFQDPCLEVDDFSPSRSVSLDHNSHLDVQFLHARRQL